MMRLATLTLAAALCGHSALAQTPPTANTVAAAEVALHCVEILVRADQMANFALYAPGDPQPTDAQLDAIEQRFESALSAYAAAAGYDAETVAARRTVHMRKITAHKAWQIRENAESCAAGAAPIPLMSYMEMPKAPFAFAMAGRGANDVLYVDTASLYRNGGAVAGWQLYVFRSDQLIDGKPVKAQWMPFRVSCIGTPEITTYGSAWLADLRQEDALPLITKIGEGSRKQVVANSFGAATWMIACDVTPPTTLYSTLSAAADHTAAIYAALQQQPTSTPQ